MHITVCGVEFSGPWVSRTNNRNALSKTNSSVQNIERYFFSCPVQTDVDSEGGSPSRTLPRTYRCTAAEVRATYRACSESAKTFAHNSGTVRRPVYRLSCVNGQTGFGRTWSALIVATLARGRRPISSANRPRRLSAERTNLASGPGDVFAARSGIGT